MHLEILSNQLLESFVKASPKELLQFIKKIESERTPVDYFAFYNSISTVTLQKLKGKILIMIATLNIDF